MSISDRFLSFLTDGIIYLKNFRNPGSYSQQFQVYYGPAPMYGVPEPQPLSWLENIWQSEYKVLLLLIPFASIVVIIGVLYFGVKALGNKKKSTAPVKKT